MDLSSAQPGLQIGLAINKIAPELKSRVAARWEEYGIGIPYLDDARRELLTMEQLSKRLPDV